MIDSAALAAREKFMKQDVNFAFDSAVLDATAQAILKDKAAWLKSNIGCGHHHRRSLR